MRKPAFSICKNKGADQLCSYADQLCGNRTADQHRTADQRLCVSLYILNTKKPAPGKERNQNI